MTTDPTQPNSNLPSPAVILGGIAAAIAIIASGIGAVDWGSDALNILIPLFTFALSTFFAFITGRASRNEEVRTLTRQRDSVDMAWHALRNENARLIRMMAPESTDPREVS